MLQIVLGVVAGFFGWMIAWIGGETVLSLIWPAFGVHQAAFQNALTEGGEFTADTKMLVAHIVLASIVSVIAGFLGALIAGENKRAPLVLGFLLLALGLLKAAMSWPLVPIWYHVIFTAILFLMTIMGGKLKTMS